MISARTRVHELQFSESVNHRWPQVGLISSYGNSSQPLVLPSEILFAIELRLDKVRYVVRRVVDGLKIICAKDRYFAEFNPRVPDNSYESPLLGNLIAKQGRLAHPTILCYFMVITAYVVNSQRCTCGPMNVRNRKDSIFRERVAVQSARNRPKLITNAIIVVFCSYVP